MVQTQCLGVSLLLLVACGLERDWERWQQASQSGETGSEGEVSSGETTSRPGDASSGTSAADSTSSDETSTGAVDETSASSSDGSSSEASGPASVCGDGVVEGEEECDDPGDTACFKCYRDRIVFITSKGYQGDWAEGFTPNNFDFYCNQHAAWAGLLTNNQPRFKVWISTSTASAAERLYHSPGRYVLRNGLVFAESWDDLVAGNLLNTLNVDENSQTYDASAWTDTRPDGTAIAAMDGDHCSDWTDASLDSGFAYFGFADKLDDQWTMYPDPLPCIGENALYCFESP